MNMKRSHLTHLTNKKSVNHSLSAQIHSLTASCGSSDAQVALGSKFCSCPLFFPPFLPALPDLSPPTFLLTSWLFTISGNPPSPSRFL